MQHKLLLIFSVFAAMSLGHHDAFARGGGGGGRSSGGYSSRSSGGIYSGTGSNSQSHSTRGYTRSDGRYVAPHRSTNPNNSQRDNYEARGNFNPSNGRVGTNGVNR